MAFGEEALKRALRDKLVEVLRGELGLEVYNPYMYGGNRYKGQHHVHTTNSDGDSPPDAVVTRYRDELGFHYIVFTDHNYLTSGAPYTVEGRFLAFTGVEDDGFWADHMVGVGDLRDYPSRTDPFDPPRRATMFLGFGGIPQIAHPNWGNIDIMEVMAMPKPILIEVYNYRVGGRMPEGLSFWDLVLRGGQVAWGVAVDDCHVLATESGRGWVVVFADRLTKRDIMVALMRGSFYATTGPDMYFSVHGRDVCVESPTGVRVRAITARGLVADVRSSRLCYTLRAGDGYVRFEVQDDAGRWAWSNPFLDMATFPKLDITQKLIKHAIEYGATDGEPAGGSTSSTSFVGIYARTSPKFELNIFTAVRLAGTQNPGYARIRHDWAGSRLVLDDSPLGADNVYLLEGEIGLVHANKRFTIALRTVDATYPVAVSGGVWFKRVFLPYLLPENAII
jgi:hypothetical protein